MERDAADAGGATDDDAEDANEGAFPSDRFNGQRDAMWPRFPQLRHGADFSALPFNGQSLAQCPNFPHTKHAPIEISRFNFCGEVEEGASCFLRDSGGRCFWSAQQNQSQSSHL